MFLRQKRGKEIQRLVPSTAAGGTVVAGGCGSGSTVAGGRTAVGGGRSAVVAGNDGNRDGGTLLGLLVLGDLDGLADSLEGDADDLQGRNSIGGGESSGTAAGLGAQDDLAHLLKDLSVNVLSLVGRATEVVDGDEGTTAGSAESTAAAASSETATAAVAAATTTAVATATAGTPTTTAAASARPVVVVPRGWLSAGQSGQACEQALKSQANPDYSNRLAVSRCKKSDKRHIIMGLIFGQSVFIVAPSLFTAIT